MTKFTVNFQVQGMGEVNLPVTPLDALIIQVNGLEIKTFRFSVLNTLASAIDFDITSSQTGPGADKALITFDSNPVTLQPGVDTIITATITPVVELLEGDLVDINILGTSI